MLRKIIHIDEALCNGCGICVNACHEGAIGLVDGKARLLRDDYCDGLGDCLPACPAGAIAFTEREAAPYDEAAVQANRRQAAEKAGCPDAQSRKPDPLPCGCPGTQSRALHGEPQSPVCDAPASSAKPASELRQWPVQIKLAPINAPYFNGANLLIAADCTAYAYADMHRAFMRDRITLIGCPKLDNIDYSEKLTAILAQNDIRSITVARMEVPCCGGIEFAVKTALQQSGKFIPWRVVEFSVDGEILRD